MTNSDTGGALIQEIMFAIAREYGWQDYGPKLRTAVKIDPAIFKQYVGRYQLQPGFIITILVRRGHLFAQATNQPDLELFPESATTYFATDANIEAVFEHSAAGRINALEIHQGGQSFIAKRIQ